MIKHILIPTDFSECAGYALNTGLVLAKLFQSEVHLIHAVEPPDDKAKSEILKALQVLNKQIKGKGITVHSGILEGRLQDVISGYIEGQGIDFVCMGSHGSSGFQELFLGSNAQKVIRIVRVPLLIVKQPISDFRFRNLVFASSFDLDEKPLFDYCLRFLKATNNRDTHIHLLNINTASFFTQPSVVIESSMQSFGQLCEDFKTSIHIYREFSVESGIQEFADKVDAEIIAISNKSKSTLSRILFGSSVEALVNLSRNAVLCLNTEGVHPGAN
jgi:nucleotide-binding universal stress UspA family protein